MQSLILMGLAWSPRPYNSSELPGDVGTVDLAGLSLDCTLKAYKQQNLPP